MTQLGNILSELNTIQETLQNSNSSNFSIYFLKRNKDKEAITYEVLKSIRTPEMAESLKQDIVEYTQKICNRVKKIDYKKALSMRRGELHYINWNEVPNGPSIIDQCVSTNSSKLTSSDEINSELWGYVVVANFPDKKIFAFNKYTKSELINFRKRYYMIGDSITALKKNKYFELEKSYNAIVMIPTQSNENMQNSILFVAQRFKFEDFFSYREYYQKYINQQTPRLEQKKIIDDSNSLCERCKSNFSYSLRYAKILESKKYETMTISKIKKYIKKYGLSVEIIDDKIKFEKTKIEEILEILEECHYESELTSTKYKALDKTEV